MIYYKDKDIIIRDICNKDVVCLFSWWIDEYINAHDPRPFPTDSISLGKECDWYCNMFENEVMNDNPEMNKYKYFMISDKDNKSIGFINLFGFNEELKEAELGIIIGDNSYWNRGIAYRSCKVIIDYAFSELKLNRIYIETGETNIPALRLFNKLEFQKYDEYCEEDGFKSIVMDIRKN